MPGSTKDLLNESDFDDSKGKARITTYLDIDVLKAIKDDAKSLKVGYQTYLNQVLREMFIQEESDEPSQNSVTKNLVSEMKKVKRDISQIQAKLKLKKGA